MLAYWWRNDSSRCRRRRCEVGRVTAAADDDEVVRQNENLRFPVRASQRKSARLSPRKRFQCIRTVIMKPLPIMKFDAFIYINKETARSSYVNYITCIQYFVLGHYAARLLFYNVNQISTWLRQKTYNQIPMHKIWAVILGLLIMLFNRPTYEEASAGVQNTMKSVDICISYTCVHR